MSYQSLKIIQVNYCGGAESIAMGKLAYMNHRIVFEYDQHFLLTGLNLSPFKLPLKSGLMVCEDSLFDGLFGIFNDSLPDGWGRLLLDRKLASLGINPEKLSALDRLAYVGNKGMGALSYHPEIETISDPIQLKNLDDIANTCLEYQIKEDDLLIDDLLKMNGSSAGARPKILVNLIDHNFEVSENNPLQPHNDWIIKFRSQIDPLDIGAVEYAYHLMAKAAGLRLPEARLFKSKQCSGYFGVKRFDRLKYEFVHMHSVSGLLHADHRLPCLDYETLIKVTRYLTKNVAECEVLFRYAVFNVLSHNRDDHAKNFSFLMSNDGMWQAAPAYDLTYSAGPNGEHCTMMMGEGKNPKLSHFLKLAQIADIEPKKAMIIIDDVRDAIMKWPQFAEQAGVSRRSQKKIVAALVAVDKMAFL